ncbi:MAG: OprD family outer membrane porin, partial [Myxococcota bacterium]
GFGSVVVLAVAILSSPALAAERELDEDTPPSSTREIETPIQRVFPEERERPSLFPWVRKHLQKLPPFFADTQLEARYRTYYLRKDRVIDELSAAWAMGGSLYYRSGWLKELFQVEVEGFTSQPIYAPEDRGGTLLLAPVQEGYSALGIANGKLRYQGIALTGYRQYLDLPYVNRNDSRMTPITYEAITLAKPQGALRFSTGYSWKLKTRTSDEFRSFTEVLGLEEDRGFAHGGAVWDPHEDLHLGAVTGFVPDLFAGLYAEVGFGRDLADGLELRFDGQFTHQWDIGEDLLGVEFDDTWNVGLRGSTSYAGAVFRLGFAVNGPDAPIVALYGTNPRYVDLMQRTFNRADEKALLASISYDFSHLGVRGLSFIVNFVAGFDGKILGVRRNAQEVDLTIDYKIRQGWLESFWLRLRGSWLAEQGRERDGTDVRLILRYDIPVI